MKSEHSKPFHKKVMAQNSKEFKIYSFCEALYIFGGVFLSCTHPKSHGRFDHVTLDTRPSLTFLCATLKNWEGLGTRLPLSHQSHTRSTTRFHPTPSRLQCKTILYSGKLSYGARFYGCCKNMNCNVLGVLPSTYGCVSPEHRHNLKPQKFLLKATSWNFAWWKFPAI